MPGFNHLHDSLEDRILKREIGSHAVRSTKQYTQPRGIYGCKSFVQDLDIINELTGHDGCVNALSWSKSGRLLASGSDDKVINIHSYLPDYANTQFDLATQIDTGHTRNIFSVKFMPHSNDRTIVSAAGDSQIRVFDIERAAAVMDGSRLRLSQGQANCKVFKSHGAAAKRIVTEASPFYFLSCAEDGDVRQWDIRQPESTYPRAMNRFYAARHGRSKDDAPPALISYADYQIDLMTISCSPTQPHYIALGGTALHCFLHDRRMLGRDSFGERGARPSNEEEVAAATRCVRKFAPYGQPKMQGSDSKSITACKISDYNPNELIASWNGDFIYRFDITRDDDHAKEHSGATNGSSRRVKHKDRKRKRKEASTSGLSRAGEARGISHPRTESEENQSGNDLSILLQMENGESVEIPLPSRAFQNTSLTAQTSTPRSTGEKLASQVRLVRNSLFNNTNTPNFVLARDVQPDDHALVRNRMDSVLTSSLKLLEKLDSLIRDWTYPTTESRNQIAFQQKLREDRAKTWRFVQACGTVSRVVSRRSPATAPRRVLELFNMIKPAPRESSMPLERHEQFGYDFIKAILLWLDSGIGAVMREFTCDPDSPDSSYRRRRPVSLDADMEDGVELELIPYLYSLASEHAVDDLDASSFSETGSAYIFKTEKDAVGAFARAMRLPFADLAGVAAEQDHAGRPTNQDRETAVKFWAYRVARSILKNAGIDVTHSLVDTAFGEFMGASYDDDEELAQEEGPSRFLRDDIRDDLEHARTSDENLEDSSTEMQLSGDIEEEEKDDNEDEDNDDDDDDDDDEEMMHEGDDDDDDDDSEENEPSPFLLRSSLQPRSKRNAAGSVPCTTHTNYYRGHCNVETTKDVNFYGQQDEYVISGSDCGNFFLWDKKTSKLVGIWEGDREVVNVVQGHPYEPVIAASGIDSTVKIFGIDARARRDAAMKVGIEEIDRSAFSSIGLSGRRAARERARRQAMEEEEDSDEGATARQSAFDLPERATDRAEINALIDGEEASAPPHPTAAPAVQPSHIAEPRRNTSTSTYNNDDDFMEAYETPSLITQRGGLQSRKRIQDEYQIVSANDMDRRRGARQGGFITRGMLAMLAQHVRAQQGGGDDDDDEEGAEGEQDCVIM